MRVGILWVMCVVAGECIGSTKHSTPSKTKTVRSTPITPYCVRIEYSPTGRFINASSYFAINRDVVLKDYTIETSGNSVVIDTGNIRLTYTNDGNPLSASNLKAEFKVKDEVGVWSLGLLDALKEKGLADNTLVIFTSDNGGCYIEDALNAGHHCNGSLLGQKTDAWDGGNQIPFIVRWPGKVPVGKTSDTFVSLTDILATVAAATGVERPKDAGQDSLNQLPVFLNPDRAEPVRSEMIYTGIFGQGIYSDGWVYYPFQAV